MPVNLLATYISSDERGLVDHQQVDRLALDLALTRRDRLDFAPVAERDLVALVVDDRAGQEWRRRCPVPC